MLNDFVKVMKVGSDNRGVILKSLAFLYIVYILPCFTPRNHYRRYQYIQEEQEIIKKVKYTKIYVNNENKGTIINVNKRNIVINEVDQFRIHDIINRANDLNINNLYEKQIQVYNELNEISDILSRINTSDVVNIFNPLPDDFVPQVIDKVNQDIKVFHLDGERIPLVLTSIASHRELKKAKSFSYLMSRKMHRFDDEILKDEDGRYCSKDKNARFSFWTPYPLWTTKFVLFQPDFRGSGVYEASIELLLDDKVVYMSHVKKMEKGHNEFNLSEPIRFTRVRLNARGEGPTCVHNFSAYTPSKFLIKD